MAKFIKVESSNLAKVAYDLKAKLLSVQFDSGKVYNYEKVPYETVLELLFAESVGKYFNTKIKDKFQLQQDNT